MAAYGVAGDEQLHPLVGRAAERAVVPPQHDRDAAREPAEDEVQVRPKRQLDRRGGARPLAVLVLVRVLGDRFVGIGRLRSRHAGDEKLREEGQHLEAVRRGLKDLDRLEEWIRLHQDVGVDAVRPCPAPAAGN